MNYYQKIHDLITESILINERSKEWREKKAAKKEYEKKMGRKIDATKPDPNPKKSQERAETAAKHTLGSPTEKRVAGVGAIERGRYRDENRK